MTDPEVEKSSKKLEAQDIDMSLCKEDDDDMKVNPSLKLSRISDYFTPMWRWKQSLNKVATVHTVDFIYRLLEFLLKLKLRRQETLHQTDLKYKLFQTAYLLSVSF